MNINVGMQANQLNNLSNMAPDETKCVAWCEYFTGGEVKHHVTCPYYPESLTKLYADEIVSLKQEIERLKGLIETAWLNGKYSGTINRGDQHDRAYKQFKTQNKL